MGISCLNDVCSGCLRWIYFTGHKVNFCGALPLVSHKYSWELHLAAKGSSLSPPACCETKVILISFINGSDSLEVVNIHVLVWFNFEGTRLA